MGVSHVELRPFPTYRSGLLISPTEKNFNSKIAVSKKENFLSQKLTIDIHLSTGISCARSHILTILRLYDRQETAVRTFAQKQNQPHKQVSSSLAQPTVQRMLETNSKELAAEVTNTASPRFGHDFSRIPLHSPATGAIQTKLAINQSGDIYEQKAVRISERVTNTPEPTREFMGSRFGHDFSLIPIHAPASETYHGKQTFSIDRYARGVDVTTGEAAGKPLAPLDDEGPWVESGGNGGPENDLGKAIPADTAKAVPADAGAVAATPPKLSKKNVSGPITRDCGGYKWVIQWELDKKTTKGGWVVQKVDLPFDVKGCDDKAIDPTKVGGLQPSWHPYWEAWQINKDQKVTTYAEGGDVEDDTFATSGTGDGTKGSLTQKGTAEFYDGLTLPSSFKVTDKPPAWILPTTKTAPTLTGGTGAISHQLKATWDCCSKDKTATKETKADTV